MSITIVLEKNENKREKCRDTIGKGEIIGVSTQGGSDGR